MLRRMHKSFFEYTLSRPYPYRWFTPVAVIGTIVALVVFSIINVASTGYNLEVQYSSDPNATTSGGWFEHWPALSDSIVRASCQAAILPVNSLLFTDNSALIYEIRRVTQEGADGTTNYLPSLIYNNNFLQHCNLLSVSLLLDRAQGDRTAAQIAWSPWGAELQGAMSCSVANGADGFTTVHLTGVYNWIPPSVNPNFGSYYFIGRHITSRASLWWGESLLSAYWNQLVVQLFEENEAIIKQGKDGFSKAELYFVRNKAGSSDITNSTYFNLLARWITIHDHNDEDITSGNDTDTPDSLSRLQIKPDIWTQADVLAKSFYSTIMTDLGQGQARENILNNQDLLRHFSANISATKSPEGHDFGPAHVQYDPANKTYGPLEVKPAVLATDYICQVPVRKEWANLILSLILADLVFMQAIWWVFKKAVEYIMGRRHPDMNHCEGCLQQGIAQYQSGSEVPLHAVNPKYESLRQQDTAYQPTAPEPSAGAETE